MANFNASANTNQTISSAAEKAKSAITSGLANLDPAVHQLSHFKDEAMDKAAVYFERSEKIVRENPFYFIGGAVLVGYLAGYMISRKH